MLKEGTTGHPKVGHVSTNRIFSTEEERKVIGVIYFNVLQSITA
jgi:hypothetical protein